MVVVMIMMLSAGLRLGRRSLGAGILGEATPHTEACSGRKLSTASCTVVVCLGSRLGRRFLDIATARHSLDCFDRCCNGVVAWLRPAKVGGQALKKLVELGIFPDFAGLTLLRLRGLFWIQGSNLSVAIVGESCLQRMPNSTRASDSVGTPLQSAGRYRQRRMACRTS